MYMQFSYPNLPDADEATRILAQFVRFPRSVA
jgi:hypothetical protein